VYGDTPPLNVAEIVDDWAESTAVDVLETVLMERAGLTFTRSIPEVTVRGALAEESVTV
jgi:hypothetical protein